MSTMVERVAKAIYDKATTFDGDQIAVHLGHSCIIDMSSRNSEELRENVMSVCRDAARAAIEAMTPTGHVEEAGWQAVRSINPEIWMSLDEVGQVFTAMIQAALKEQA